MYMKIYYTFSLYEPLCDNFLSLYHRDGIYFSFLEMIAILLNKK